jgi:hypothetical protein
MPWKINPSVVSTLSIVDKFQPDRQIDVQASMRAIRSSLDAPEL